MGLHPADKDFENLYWWRLPVVRKWTVTPAADSKRSFAIEPQAAEDASSMICSLMDSLDGGCPC
jgi:hypothetical protein